MTLPPPLTVMPEGAYPVCAMYTDGAVRLALAPFTETALGPVEST